MITETDQLYSQIINDTYDSLQDAHNYDLRFDIIACYLDTLNDYELDSSSYWLLHWGTNSPSL